jgi:sarcosine oxidase, subunit gamma
MAEPFRTSPLADLARPERSLAGPAPITLAELAFAGKLILRGGDDVRARAAEALGFALTEPLRSTAGEGARALWLGPDEWLLLVPGEAASTTAAVLREALAGRHHAVVVVSDRLTGIAVDGQRSREILNAGCPLDLHRRAFAPGTVARTLLGKVAVVLHRPEDDDRFELHVNGSLAPYAWRFLENAAREFGCSIAA